MNSYYFIDFKYDYVSKLAGFNKLEKEIEKAKGNDTIVLNFLRYPVTPTEEEIDRSLAKPLRRKNSFHFTFINFRREGRKILLKNTSLKKWLYQNNLIIPVFDQYCEFLCFFGLEDEISTSVFKNLLNEKETYNISIRKVDKTQRNTITKILEANNFLFQQTKKEKYGWTSKIKPKELFDQEIINEVCKVNAHVTDKHIELLSGKHTNQFIQTNKIFKNIEFPIRLARGLFSKIKGKIDFDTISAFSLTGLDFARAFQREIEQLSGKKVDLICLENYNNLSLPPTFIGDLTNKKIFIILDVNDTGGLLEQMLKFWQVDNNCKVIGIGIAIDTGNYQGALRNINFHYLCNWKIPIYDRENCPLCKSNSTPIYYVNEDTLTLTKFQETKSSPENIYQLVDKYPDAKEFWIDIAKLGVLNLHARITTGNYKDRHYLAFIDIEKLLNDSEISSKLIDRIIKYYVNNKLESKFPFDLIICVPNPKSITIASEIQRTIPGVHVEKIIPGRKKDSFYLKDDSDRDLIKNAERILIIDDGANTGDTLSGLVYLLEKNNVDIKNIKACVLIDRLSGDSLDKISKLFKKKDNFHAIYKVKIPPYVKNVHECPLCRELDILKIDIAQTESSLIHDYYLKRKTDIEVIALPTKFLSEKNKKLNRIISIKGLALPYLYFCVFLLDLIGREGSPATLIKCLKNVEKKDIILVAVEAISMFGISREEWSIYRDALMELANTLNSYEIRKNIFRIMVLKGFNINKEILNSIVNFIVENIEKKEELPFLTWLAYKIQNPQFKSLLIQRKNKCSSQTERKNLTEIINANIPKTIITENHLMYKVLERVRIVAQTNSPVLISGESGTGKELIARAIHKKSNRKDEPFIAINCGAMPSELVESDLFGYEEGAFTGAKKSGSLGKFELANRGTLFLDEIDSMSLESQAKLLRVIRNKELMRVGGKKIIQVDVRIISATKQDLFLKVEEGQFRDDLYYRIMVIPIKLPPLRERVKDIRVLIDYFLDFYRKEFNHDSVKKIDEGTLQVLERYRWPGNVAELINTIECVVQLSRGNIITKNDLPENVLNSIENNEKSNLKADESIYRSKQRQDKALDWMKNNERKINNKKYRDITDCSDETARRDLNELIKRKIINRTGKGRASIYSLQEE